MLEYEASAERDPYASVNINLAATNETTLGIVLTLVYLKPIEKPAAFSLFDKFDSLMDTTGIRTLTEIMGEFPTAALPRLALFPTSSMVTAAADLCLKDSVFSHDSQANQGADCRHKGRDAKLPSHEHYTINDSRNGSFQLAAHISRPS